MEYNKVSDYYLHVVPSALLTAKTLATKRNVTFNPTCTVRTHTCRSITEEEKLVSYYNREELRAMKREAVNGLLRTMSSERSDSVLSNTAVGATAHSSPETVRGLELFLEPQRRKNRELVRQSILKYQVLLNSQSDLTDEQRQVRLAHITAKLNRWASHVAFQTAWSDACEAVDFFHESSYFPQSSPDAAGPMGTTTPSRMSHCEMQFAETGMESFPICCTDH